MRANELRLGNWVYSTVLGEPVPILVCGIMENGVRVSPTESRPISTFSPIPLTKELLLKCGFELVCEGIVFGGFMRSIGRKRSLSMSCIGTPNEMLFIRDDSSAPADVVVLWNYDYGGRIYLHQLQNLYFCLCGEELDVKLD